VAISAFFEARAARDSRVFTAYCGPLAGERPAPCHLEAAGANVQGSQAVMPGPYTREKQNAESNVRD